MFARTETEMFVEAVWKRATALRFLFGRLYFHRPDGRRAEANAGAPSVLVAAARTRPSASSDLRPARPVGAAPRNTALRLLREDLNWLEHARHNAVTELSNPRVPAGLARQRLDRLEVEIGEITEAVVLIEVQTMPQVEVRLRLRPQMEAA